MKRSGLQQILKDRIEMRIREGHYASDNTDYERWAFAHFLADELISLIEEQGMQPPSAPFRVRNKRWNPKKEEWYEIEEWAMVNQWEPEGEVTSDGYANTLPNGGTAVGQGEPSFTSFKDLTEEEWAVLDESLKHVGIRKNRMTEEDEK